MYYYSGQIKKYEMSHACSTSYRDEKCIKIFVGKPDSKRPAGRHGHAWKDNTETDLVGV
jgi:hypothetical protein